MEGGSTGGGDASERGEGCSRPGEEEAKEEEAEAALHFLASCIVLCPFFPVTRPRSHGSIQEEVIRGVLLQCA